VKTVRVTVQAKAPVLTGNAKILEDAEEAFRGGKLAESKEIWSKLMASTDDRPTQARAYYGLGRVALSERSPERADQLFRKVLDLNPDASTLSWTLVYLGKLSDSQGEAEAAKQFYSKVLAIAEAPEQVKREAQQGLTGAFFRARPPEAEEPEEDPDADLDDLP
jgi:tetratricopeptide (TPR) repeat protein